MKKIVIGYMALTTLLLAVVFAASAGLITSTVNQVQETPAAGPATKVLIDAALADTRVVDQVYSGQHIRLGVIAPLHLAGVSQRQPFDGTVEDYILTVLRQNVAPEFDIPEIKDNTRNYYTGFATKADINPVYLVIDEIQRQRSDALDSPVVKQTADKIFIPLMKMAQSNNQQCQDALIGQGQSAEDAEAICRRDDAALNFIYYTLFDPAERVVLRYRQGNINAYFCTGSEDQITDECGIDGSVASARGLHDLEGVTVYFQAQQFVVDNNQDQNNQQCVQDEWTICTEAGPTNDTCPNGQTCFADHNSSVKGRWAPLPLENDIVKIKLGTINPSTQLFVPFPYPLEAGTVALNGIYRVSADINGRLDINNDTENHGDAVRSTRFATDVITDNAVLHNFLKNNVVPFEFGSVDAMGAVTHEAQGTWQTDSTFKITDWPIKNALKVVGEQATSSSSDGSLVQKSIYLDRNTLTLPFDLTFRNINGVDTGLSHLECVNGATGGQDVCTAITYTKVLGTGTLTFRISAIPADWNFDPSKQESSRNDVWWILPGTNIDLNNLEVSANGVNWPKAFNG